MHVGTAQPAYLVVLPDDYTLFVRRGIEFAHRESDLQAERIVQANEFEAVASQMFPGSGEGRQVGSELELLTVPHWRRLSRTLGARELVDISGDVLSQRAVKDAQEIDSMRKACAAVHAGHHVVLSALRGCERAGVGCGAGERPASGRP